MQRFVVGALAIAAVAGTCWLLSGPEERTHQQASAGGPAESAPARDLHAPRGVASGAGTEAGVAGSRAPGAIGGDAPTSSGRAGSTGSSTSGERQGGDGPTDERLRGSGGGSSRRMPDPEPPIDPDSLAKGEEDDASDEAMETEDVADREADAAAIAEQMGLLDEPTLARRSERAMRSDPTLSQEAARNRVLADALIRIYLLSRKFPDTPIDQLSSKSIPGDPLSSISADQRDALLEEASEAFSSA